MAQSAIADSAFLVNELRARNPSLSLDQYAHLWVNDRTREICKTYDQEVYPDDEVALGIRNRFFFNLIETYFQKPGDKIFVNLGAGFTNYPFLIRTPIKTIEVDLPHVVDYKKQKLSEFTKSGKLPVRDINFIATDFNDSGDVAKLEKQLLNYIGNSESLFLLEGLTYYLKPSAFRSLIELICNLQKPNSVLALDYWPPHLRNHETCEKFRIIKL